MTDLAAIQARLDAATPSPWFANVDGSGNEGDGVVYANHQALGRIDIVLSCSWSKAHANFIANAPGDIASLLSLVCRQRERIRNLEAIAKRLVADRGVPMDIEEDVDDFIWPDQRELSGDDFIQRLIEAGWPPEKAKQEWEATQRGERD